ncbi:CHAT domain-containing protein [Okeania sp. SIO2B3]|uniref:CHAT domain-containing protein n=1 Tax=Okeania sp. SIO2B3 TaxID=2607784 RepID=UPI0013BED847|nr:CHAT domain-containing protein [Okeania sp. SIO2B3]NET44150.1 CHAT domain-containing protein [Okeania sp. SIO2B3]
MTNLSITNTLMIILLALRRLKNPLSEDELDTLRNEGFALETSPEYWEDIEETLMTIVEENEELNWHFQTIKKELELVEEIPTEFLPTWEELETELTYGDSEPVTFGVEPDDNPDITPTIVAASTILKSGDPTQLVLNLSSLKRLQFALDEFSATKPRYINTGFYTLDNTELIETNQPLALHRPLGNRAHNFSSVSYILKVNVGDFWGICSPKKSIPEQLLIPFYEKEESLEMDVVVNSFDVRVDSPQQKLQLPKKGNSDFVDFRIFLTRTGRQTIDIDLLFHGHLLQSKRVEVYVVQHSGDVAPESAFPVQDAYITWTRSAILNPDELKIFKEKPRRLTIVTERDIDYNRIGLRFYDTTGKDLGCQHSRLTDDSLTQMLAALRTQLVKSMNAYAGTIGSTEGVLTKHLGQLAAIGRKFYLALLPGLAKQENRVDRSDKLKVDLEPETIIQVAPLSSQLGVPWELLYERKIEKYREGRITLCPTWKEHGSKPEDCPSYGTEEEARVVCPHSFWGYRYIIEQLPCKITPHTSAPQHSLPLLIRNQLPLQFKAIVFNDFKQLNNHWEKLHTLASEDLLKFLRIDSLDKLQPALSDSNNPADILYFYTHGGSDDFGTPYLEVGDGEQIELIDLDAWNVNFKEHQSLVVLNACDSADYTPDNFENLLQFFCDRGAAGVIGTQCEVKEKLADAFILNFFQSFLQQNPAGEALFKSRQSLLREHLDPRGLTYSLFASADVKLAQKVIE